MQNPYATHLCIKVYSIKQMLYIVTMQHMNGGTHIFISTTNIKSNCTYIPLILVEIIRGVKILLKQVFTGLV